MCPSVNPDATQFFYALTRPDYATANLFPKLLKFYADVESTGASSEFYDKFNIRRSIQVIFRDMWADLNYRNRMMEIAQFVNHAKSRLLANDARACRESPPYFTRFINM